MVGYERGCHHLVHSVVAADKEIALGVFNDVRRCLCASVLFR